MWRALGSWGRMVKFSHSVFALPFAFSGATLAAATGGLRWQQLAWIAVAMIGARNAAMGFNRLADHDLDARNPRTAQRELPRGSLSRGAVWIFTVALTGLFVFAAFRLSPLCGWLSPLALIVIFGYSYTKRFSWGSHLVLGLGLAIAPVGGWLAIAGHFTLVPWLLAAAVAFWVAGFDVIYACQDVEFDTRVGLRSIPQRFGLRGALRLARLFHVVAVAAMIAVGAAAALHPIYWVGVLLIAGLLLWEHRLIRANDLSRVGVAFFNLNGIISLLYFVTILSAVVWSHWGASA